MNSKHYDFSKAWAQKNLIDSIYLNDPKSLEEIPPQKRLPKKVIPKVLPTAHPLSAPIRGKTVSEKILNLMLSKSVRRGARQAVSPFAAPILEKIEILVKHNQPISFVLPSLPFKDQSPFGTGAAIDHVDLGEYAFFAQIKRILDAIQSIYPPGAHMTVLCDGLIYAGIFTENDTEGAGRYKAACERIKNEYSLYNTVTLYDMREVFFDIPHWREIESDCEKAVWDLYENDAQVRFRIDHLAKRFMYYTSLSGQSYESARKLYSQTPWPDWVWERLLSSAIKYSVVHLAMKKTNVVMEAFPSAIRCTVHPKPAPQLPLHLANPRNKLLPYNGVPLVSHADLEKGLSLFQAMRVQRLCDVMRHENVTAVYIENQSHPFYYEIG